MTKIPQFPELEFEFTLGLSQNVKMCDSPVGSVGRWVGGRRVDGNCWMAANTPAGAGAGLWHWKDQTGLRSTTQLCPSQHQRRICDMHVLANQLTNRDTDWQSNQITIQPRHQPKYQPTIS